MSRTKKKKRRSKGRGRGEANFTRRKTVTLEDGTVGYAMLPDRADDCFRAAIATALQVSPREVPDPQIDRRMVVGQDPEAISADSWGQIERWLDSRGLRLVFHEAVPVDADRWIGVCGAPGPNDAEFIAQYNEVFGHHRSLRRGLQQTRKNSSMEALVQFSDHCLVMSYGDVLFDPAVGIVIPLHGLRMRAFEAADITYGLSFEPAPNKGA